MDGAGCHLYDHCMEKQLYLFPLCHNSFLTDTMCSISQTVHWTWGCEDASGSCTERPSSIPLQACNASDVESWLKREVWRSGECSVEVIMGLLTCALLALLDHLESRLAGPLTFPDGLSTVIYTSQLLMQCTGSRSARWGYRFAKCRSEIWVPEESAFLKVCVFRHPDAERHPMGFFCIYYNVLHCFWRTNLSLSNVKLFWTTGLLVLLNSIGNDAKGTKSDINGFPIRISR